MMRLGAAAVVHGIRRGTSITVVSSLEEGLNEAYERGALELVDATRERTTIRSPTGLRG